MTLALAQKFEAKLILLRVLQTVLRPIVVMSSYGDVVDNVAPAFQDESEINLSKLYLKTVLDKFLLPARIRVIEVSLRQMRLLTSLVRNWWI